jgi:hypothetical protein
VKLRLKGFSDQEIVEGGEDAQRRARDELRREQRLRVAMQSGWPELARADLIPAHLGLLEHTPTGDFYAVSRGEQYGEKFDTAGRLLYRPDRRCRVPRTPVEWAEDPCRARSAAQSEGEPMSTNPRTVRPWVKRELAAYRAGIDAFEGLREPTKRDVEQARHELKLERLDGEIAVMRGSSTPNGRSASSGSAST